MPTFDRPRRGPRGRSPGGREAVIGVATVAVLAIVAAAIYFWPAMRGYSADTADNSVVNRLTDPSVVPVGSTAAYPPLPEQVDVVKRIETTEPVVFITIDDGWHRDPRILDLLRQRQAPVTVFPNGELVESDLEYWRAFVELGGTIEDHTHDHPFLGRTAADEQSNQICAPADQIQRLFGRRPTMLRPPFGSYNDETKIVTPDCGQYVLVHWSVEIRHRNYSFAGSPKELAPGDIILLHFRPETYDELVDLFARMDALGLRAAPLQDYLGPFARSDEQRAQAAATA